MDMVEFYNAEELLPDGFLKSNKVSKKDFVAVISPTCFYEQIKKQSIQCSKNSNQIGRIYLNTNAKQLPEYEKLNSVVYLRDLDLSMHQIPNN